MAETPNATPWSAHAADVVVPVQCDGDEHRVVWRSDGRLHLIDHADPDADEVFRALGGPDVGCLQLLDLWRSAVTDGGFLGEWAFVERQDPRRTHWLGTAWKRLANEGVQDFLRGIDQQRAKQMGSVLLRFPDELLDRAAMTVLAERGTEIASDSWLMSHVIEATHVRARSAFVRSLDHWRGYARPAALVPFRPLVLPGIDADAAGQLRGRESHVEIVLSSEWLARVWSRGAADVDGHLVLDIDETPNTETTNDFTARVLDWQPEADHLIGAIRETTIVHDPTDLSWKLRT